MQNAGWKKTAFMAVIAVLSGVNLAAAEKTFLNRIFFDDFADAGRTIAEDPLKSGIIAGSALLAGWLVFANDGRIAAEMKKRNDFNTALLDTADYFGSGYYVLAANSFLFLGGDREKKAAGLVVEAMLVSGAVSTVLKACIGRIRPSSTDDPYVFRPFSAFDLSMPSGHSEVAFCWATILGDTYDIGWLTYPAAGLVAWARVYRSAHWPSDVLIGGVIGVVTAKILKASRDKEDGNAQMEVKYSEMSTPMIGVNIRL